MPRSPCPRWLWFELWTLCSHLLIAGIRGVHHHVVYTVLGLNAGSHVCYVSTQLTESHLQSSDCFWKYIYFLRQRSVCSPGCPRTHGVPQADLKLTRILLLLPSEHQNYRLWTPNPAKAFFRVFIILTSSSCALCQRVPPPWSVALHEHFLFS